MRILMGLIVLLASVAARAATTPADMPPDTWLEVPNTPMKAVAPDMEKFPKVRAIMGPAAVIIAWGGAALDTKRDRLVLWGGGHADYYGNELYAFDVKKLAWERLTDPFPEPEMNREVNPDGTPGSRHTYSGMAYLADADRLFAFGGSLAGSGFARCDHTWTFNFDTKKWDDRQPKVKSPDGGIGQGCAYDPANRKLYFVNGRGLWGYDYDKNEWTRLQDGDFYYHTLTIDTKRHLLIGAGHGAMFAYDLNKPDFKREDRKTTGGDEFIKAANPGFDYDPVADQYVGWHEGKVYVLDPEKKTWSISAAKGGPDHSVNGTFGRWRYVPSINAFILVTDWTANVFFYKHTPGGKP